MVTMQTGQAEPDGAEIIPRIEAEAVNREETRALYASRVKVYPKQVEGTFRRLKWLIMAATLGLYYGAPWLRWDRGPHMPDQAILIDLPGRRFFFFFIEIWPDEIYYLTGLLILAALILFLVTALAGRVWCGYTCPQTVWSDLFIAVERLIEGDRNKRMRRDASPLSAETLALKGIKHVIWVLIALATGGAWVFYFADAPGLAADLARFSAPNAAYIAIAILTATTYLLGAIAREQVCIYMCPWPRIQGGLQDEDSLIVSYHSQRGEPRGRHKKGMSWEGRGDCVDCNQCVAVCPMGIDIRDGLQMECISCALCIDACNSVMDKVDRPRNLIGYDTLAGVERAGKAPRRPDLWRLLFRPRILVYLAAILVVGLVMLGALVQRSPLEVSVEADRNPLYVRLSDGSLRNGYTVRVMNKRHEARIYSLAIDGLEAAQISIVGGEGVEDPPVSAPANQMRSYRVFVTVPPETAAEASTLPFRFVLTDRESGETAGFETRFQGPGR